MRTQIRTQMRTQIRTQMRTQIRTQIPTNDQWQYCTCPIANSALLSSPIARMQTRASIPTKSQRQHCTLVSPDRQNGKSINSNQKYNNTTPLSSNIARMLARAWIPTCALFLQKGRRHWRQPKQYIWCFQAPGLDLLRCVYVSQLMQNCVGNLGGWVYCQPL